MKPKRRKAKATIDYGAQHDTHVLAFEDVARELFTGIIELNQKGRFRRRYFENGSAEDRLARAAVMRVMSKWLPLLAASPRHGDADILLHLIAAFDLDENKIKPPLNEVRDRKIMLLNRKKRCRST